jgi:N-acyl-L-homoserine lactone synthetase
MKIKQFLQNKLLDNFYRRKKLKFKIAKTEKELEMVYHLSWKIYSQEGYINPNDFPNKLYSDKYDRYSVNFLALANGNPVGALRLILWSPLGFYIEKDFPIEHPSIPPNKIAELSRFVVLKEYRGGKRLVSLGLLRSALEFSKNRGITHWYALMGEKLKKSFEVYGVQIQPLSFKRLTEEQLRERKILADYYNKIKPLPYIISLNSIA